MRLPDRRWRLIQPHEAYRFPDQTDSQCHEYTQPVRRFDEAGESAAGLPLQLGHDFRAAEPEDDELIREYLTLKMLVSEAEERLDALKPRLIDMVLDQPDDDGRRPRACAYGFEFSLQFRRSYEYSAHVQELADQLKATRKYEEAHGIAQVTKQQAILVTKALKI